MFLYDIIIKSAQAQLKAQNDDGSMPAGNNGPKNKLEELGYID
ncbi:MAG: hypothetical protein AABY43_04490 [Candidatus Omnitrophota bacterium]